jgi:hypothetical protein
MKNDLEIMRIWRVPPLGKLAVEATGNRYDNLAEISDPKLRQRLLAAIGELVSFAGGYQELVDAGFAPAIVPTPVKKPGEEETAVISAELARQQEEFLARLSGQTIVPPPPPSRGLLGGLGRPSTPPATEAITFTETGEVQIPPPPAAPPRPKSIAEQIDTILQKHLAADPKLAGRPVSLEQSPSGGLRIVVDGVYYEKPTDIPDKDIQLAIKMAVKEWNAS